MDKGIYVHTSFEKKNFPQETFSTILYTEMVRKMRGIQKRAEPDTRRDVLLEFYPRPRSLL